MGLTSRDQWQLFYSFNLEAFLYALVGTSRQARFSLLLNLRAGWRGPKLHNPTPSGELDPGTLHVPGSFFRLCTDSYRDFY